MKIQEKTGNSLEARLDEIAGRLRKKEITVPTDLLGGGAVFDPGGSDPLSDAGAGAGVGGGRGKRAAVPPPCSCG